MKAITIPQIDKASTEEKLELIDDLWASIPAAEVEPLDSHLTELSRRLKGFTANPEHALDLGSARERIREITGL